MRTIQMTLDDDLAAAVDTVVPITSTIRDIPSEVLLSKQDGMHNACVINCDHLQTVSKGNIGSLITTLSTEKLLHNGDSHGLSSKKRI